MIKIDFTDLFIPSKDIVAREIGGELLIVPIVAGIGDLEDDLYTLEDTGKDIWSRLTGKDDLHQIINDLVDEYDASYEEISADVLGLIGELLRRKIITKLN
ncbi:PqqD family protein [Desulfosediminicola flagellatus]|uniref:PqqD family protein n=1 Tax=Desulfosediminicola flagellatus TaxID=2569541 RepID=UPI0010AD662A|nr:PqqD family protein [Desulfosediminicola flagellatus]